MANPYTLTTTDPSDLVNRVRQSWYQTVFNNTLHLDARNPALAFLASDQNLTQSSTTLQNITGMSVAIAASRVYAFDLFLRVTFPSATPDIKVALTVPASCVARAQIEGVGNLVVELDMTSAQASDIGSAITTLIRYHGLLINSTTAGTVQVQAAQNTSDASTVTVKAYSYVRVALIN